MLSEREQSIKEYVLKGLSNKKIGKILNIKESTVKFHTTNIYKKSDVKSRSEFIVKVLNLRHQKELSKWKSDRQSL